MVVLLPRHILPVLVLACGCTRYGFLPQDDAALDVVSLDVALFSDARPDTGGDGRTDLQRLDLPGSDHEIADLASPDHAVKPDQWTKLDAPVPPPPDLAPPPDTAPPPPGSWVTVGPGIFSMGSPTSEACRDSDETQHSVVIAHGFVISKTETTQAEFSARMIYNPSFYSACGASCPVESVTWHEAAAYCNSLSVLTGHSPCYVCSGTQKTTSCTVSSSYQGTKTIIDCPGFRLPTDAEWEYAARATTTTPFYNGYIGQCKQSDTNADALGWYKHNSGGATHPTGQKLKNLWGLYDMAGNVREWTGDWYTANLGTGQVTDPVGPANGTTRVTRGGHYFDFAETLRSAHRDEAIPNNQFDNLGFRCVRTL